MKGILFSLFALTAFVVSAQSSFNNMTETSSGYIGIGTTTPDQLLTVNGTIHTREVLVDLDGAVAPDYVFDYYFDGSSSLKSNYTMPSLYTLEDYLRTHRHLPGVPSATQIDNDGLNLKEMNLLLLEKVEELTLYTIEQQKQIDDLIIELQTLIKSQATDNE